MRPAAGAGAVRRHLFYLCRFGGSRSSRVPECGNAYQVSVRANGNAPAVCVVVPVRPPAVCNSGQIVLGVYKAADKLQHVESDRPDEPVSHRTAVGPIIGAPQIRDRPQAVVPKRPLGKGASPGWPREPMFPLKCRVRAVRHGGSGATDTAMIAVRSWDVRFHWSMGGCSLPGFD